MNFNPGPWEARPSGYSITGRAGGPFYLDVYAGTVNVASLLYEYDARLIAAAPEMLEALRAVEWVVRAGGANVCPWCKSLYPDHMPDCLRQIAVAKAEGQP